MVHANEVADLFVNCKLITQNRLFSKMSFDRQNVHTFSESLFFFAGLVHLLCRRAFDGRLL